MTGSRLAALLDQATPGPWEPICDPDDEERAWVLAVSEGARTYVVLPPSVHDMGMLDADARLIALAPEMARLLVDMAAWTRDVRHMALIDQEPDYDEMDALIARFAALDEKAGGS